MLLENGVYRAVVKDVSMYLRGDNERLTAAFRLECEGKEIVHREWLELNDGTISDKAIRRLRQCFPKWDGSIETLEQGFCVQDVEVDVTVENEQDRDDPEKWWTRTRYMDPPGGGSGPAAMPERESRATLVGKYGARFRALAGGKPAAAASAAAGAGTGQAAAGGEVSREGAKARTGTGTGEGAHAEARSARRGEEKAPARATASAAPVAPPPAGKRPQAEPVAVSSLEDCWEALCKKHPDEFREQVTDRWYALLERVVPNRDQADFGPEDWGAVMTEIALPF